MPADVFEVVFESSDLKRKGSKTVPARRYVTVRAADADQAVALAELSERRYADKRLSEALEAEKAERGGRPLSEDAYAKLVSRTLKSLGTWRRLGVSKAAR